MSDRKPPLSRRDAVLALGAAGAAAAATVAARSSAPVLPAAPAASEPPPAGGYRETAHVARYYRSTRI